MILIKCFENLLLWKNLDHSSYALYIWTEPESYSWGGKPPNVQKFKVQKLQEDN